ncbi:MAG: single-stranded-DNA-specific exonuclease RecJ [Caldilineaceae bacterium]
MSLSALKNWNLLPVAPRAFLNAVPENELLTQVLYNRGLRSVEAIQEFLTHADAIKENPYRMRDMAQAVQRIVRAIEKGETICVYGDFDADGVASTALLVTALQMAGGRVGPYIPDRFDEGYGLNVEAISRIAGKAKLLVTVDCGIRSIAEVRHALTCGLDVIITDHHTVGPELPPALAVINPRRADCPSKFDRLAGVGVAYRLAQAVLRAVAQQKWSRIKGEEAELIETQLLDLVALGTVADMMPLLGENRSLVHRGLQQINQPLPRLGLRALMQQADLRHGSVDTAAISFRLAPRINAAGRLDKATTAYELLRARDEANAYLLATTLESLNQRRQNLTTEAQAEAEAQVAAQMGDDPAIYIVHSQNFEPGIVGLVAGKLTERFYRPTIVIEQGDVESHGSARSIHEFDISAALDQVSSLLVRHGGHTRAAGFTIKSELIPVFAHEIRQVAAQQLGSMSELRPTLDIDAEIKFDQLNWGLLEQFSRLEPTGQENPQPVLLARRVRVVESRMIGQGKHVRLGLESVPTEKQAPPGKVLDAVAFQQGSRAKWLAKGSLLDIVFTLESNEWNGNRSLQLNLQDMRVAE